MYILTSYLLLSCFTFTAVFFSPALNLLVTAGIFIPASCLTSILSPSPLSQNLLYLLSEISLCFMDGSFQQRTAYDQSQRVLTIILILILFYLEILHVTYSVIGGALKCMA